jgi:hypothetical protein
MLTIACFAIDMRLDPLNTFDEGQVVLVPQWSWLKQGVPSVHSEQAA